MKIVVGGRGSGKTTRMIKEASERNAYIVCANHQEAVRIVRCAEQLGLHINFPLTNDEFLGGMYVARGIEEILVDNADDLIRYISRVPVGMITLTQEKE